MHVSSMAYVGKGAKWVKEVLGALRWRMALGMACCFTWK